MYSLPIAGICTLSGDWVLFATTQPEPNVHTIVPHRSAPKDLFTMRFLGDISGLLCNMDLTQMNAKQSFAD